MPPIPQPARPMAGPGVPLSSPLLNPDAPLTGQALYNAAAALANAQTAGPLAEIARQIAQNNQQTTAAGKLTSGYFDQLGQQAQQGADRQGQLATGLNQTLAGIGNDTQNALQGIGQNAQSSLLKYAPQSESSNSLAQPALQSLTQEIARQQGLAAQNAGTFRAFGANQGANYQGLANSQLGTFAQRGQEALKGIAQAGQLKNEPLVSKQAALNAQHGALLTTDLGKLRQQELTNQFTAQGLGVKQYTAAQTAAQNATKDRIAQQNANTNASRASSYDRLNNATIAERQAQAALDAAKTAGLSGAGKAKPLPTTKQYTVYQTIDKLPAIIQSMQQPLSAKQATALQNSGLNVKQGQTLTGQQISQLLGTKFDPKYVEIGFQLINTPGTISRQQAAYLYGQGLRGGHYQLMPTANVGAIGSTIGGAANALGNIRF